MLALETVPNEAMETAVPDLRSLTARDAAPQIAESRITAEELTAASLDRIAVADLGELIVEAWLSRAPKRLAEEYLRLPR